MNLQFLSTPLHIHPKTTWFNNFGGVSIKPIINQRFTDGFCNRAKRVSKSSFRFKKGGHLIRLWCHNGLNDNNNDVNNDDGDDDDDDEKDDGYYMRKCVELARKAIGCTSPNPMVGCLIVKDGRIVGRGFHPMAGQPHAEVFALRDAGELAEKATAYVSLEPCNHYGRTPPCSEALVNAKVKKVVLGMVDPNPIVSSKGIDRLREAGIEVVVGIEEDLCKKLNEAFIHKMLYGKPFVTLRYSITINGVVLNELEEEAMTRGGYYSKLLQEYDAVIHLPQTTQEFSIAASHEPNAHQPLHILIAKNVDSPIQIINLPTNANFKAIVFAEKEVALDLKMSEMGIETVIMDQLSLHAILEYCSRQGVNSVLVDSRGKLDGLEDIIEDGFDTNSLQKIVVEVLPFCADSNVSSSSILSVTQRKQLKSLSARTCGRSILLEGYF